jgi:hypothetical protein
MRAVDAWCFLNLCGWFALDGKWKRSETLCTGEHHEGFALLIPAVPRYPPRRYSPVSRQMVKPRVAESTKTDADTLANGGHGHANLFLKKHAYRPDAETLPA